MTLIIGLTGSIGTGKSTIANHMKALHIPIVDADVVAREIVEPGKKAYNDIVETFGKEVLYEDGTINRPALGKIVFSDEAKRKALNAITHPEIRKEIIRQREAYVAQEVPCVVLDIPLLYESNLIDYVDKVIVVSVSEQTQMKRVMERDGSTKEAALQRIQSQIPVKEKEKMADAVIDNNGTKEASYKQLEDILTAWNIPIK